MVILEKMPNLIHSTYTDVICSWFYSARRGMRWRTNHKGIISKHRLTALPNTIPSRRPVARDDPSRSKRIGGPKKNSRQIRRQNPVTRAPRQP